MDIDLSVLRFVGFLGVVVTFLIAIMVAVMPLGFLIMSSGEVKSWYITLNSLLLETISAVFIFLFIWVLTGIAHVTLLGILILVPIVAIIGAELVWLVVGSPNVPYPGRLMWLRYELTKVWPKTAHTLELSGLLPLVVYTIYIGIGYFGETQTADQWTRFVFQATILFIFGSLLVLLPQSFYTITSANILGPTRTRIFISQLANAVPMMVYMSLFLWATTDVGTHLEPLGSVLIISPKLAFLSVAYVLLFIVLPFVIGHYRSKHEVASLQAKRNKRIDEFLTAIGSPGVDQAERKLAELDNKLQADISGLESDRSVHIALEVLNSNEEDVDNALAKIALRDSIDRDPRFIHLSAVQDIVTRLSELNSAIEGFTTAEDKRASFNVTTAELQRVRSHKYDSDSSANVWAIGIVSSAGTALLSPLWSTVTHYLLGLIGLETQK